MTLVGRKIIERFARKHRDARQWLAEWIRNVAAATWHGIDDVRRTYPATDGGVRMTSGKLVTVFNVKGNEYRLVADVVYGAQILVVLDLVSHAEYSKDLWKKRNYP